MTAPDYALCPYCGTLPAPLALQREDGTMTDPSEHDDEHARDCPYYRPTVQARPYGSATVFRRP